jgi:hypothetical protein
MLKWYEENSKHLGFDDDTFLYRAAKDESGWYWEYVPDMDGFDGYDTAEEAMAAAEKDYEEHDFDIDWEDLEPLDLEDLEDAYWEAAAHERMEITKGLF